MFHTGADVLQVATHEIGHKLGLDHSNVPSAVMHSTYSYKYNFKLHPDDVAAIKSLYPPKKGTYY